MQLTAWKRMQLTAVLAVAYTTEHADQHLLSAMFLAIGRALNISVARLGTLSMWRALVQAICIPFVGIAGDACNRIALIVAGTIIWGSMSVGMGFAANYAEAAAWSALNGVGLALVLPCVQSIIAEIYVAKSRGRAFGAIFTISAFGGMLMTFVAITYSNKEIGGHQGWRIMYLVMSGVAGAATLIVLFGGEEPRRLKGKQAAPAPHVRTLLQTLADGLRLIARNTAAVFRVKSFLIILTAGIVGAISITGYSYKTLYFQILGFSDIGAATLSTCTTAGLALGFLIGGAAGDWLSVRFPNAARPFINQLSLLLAGPFIAVLYKAMPGCSRFASGVPGSLDHLLPEYGLLLFFTTMLASWPASNNAAIFAEVVPEAIRTSVYAFDKCIIGAVGALTTPLAGLLAEKAFGFTHLSKGHSQHHAHAPATAASLARLDAEYRANVNNARALENGLMITLLIPMALKFFVYFGLYYTLPHDRIEELAEPEPAAGAAGSGPGGGWVAASKEPAGEKPPPGGVSGAAGGSLRGGIALATLRSVGLTPCKAEYSSLPSTPDAKLQARTADGGDWISPAGGRRSHQDLSRAVSEDSTEEGGSWRSASLGSVSRYIAVELTQLPPAGTSPAQPCAAARKGDASV